MMTEEITTTEELSDVSIDDLIGETKKLVVFNDDVNSFEYVQECFCAYLKHTPEQAIQCATIIHNKGKYAVKAGSMEYLEPYFTALGDAGLTVEIQ